MVRTVSVLMMSEDIGRDMLPLQSLILGIRLRVSDANVQISFLPDSGALSYVHDLIQASLSAGEVAGFVPVSCPREVYRVVADSGVPTVVHGTLCSDQQDIPSIDVDNREAGRLLTEYLIEAGHRRIALLTSMERQQPGDNCFFDGMSEVLTDRGMPHNALIIRTVPAISVALSLELEKLLGVPDPPTGLIVRTPAMARALSAALDRIGMPAGRYEIVYQNYLAVEDAELPFTHVQPRLSFGEIAAQMGEMLEELGKGKIAEAPHIVVPIDLCRRIAP